MENLNLNTEILNQLNQIRIDVEFIKGKFEDDFKETELTDWAKKELEEARATPKDEFISMEEIKKEFL